MEEALAECDQINATFDALLRISQIEAGVRKLHFQPLALDQLLLNVVETYADVAEDNRQSLTAGQIDAATIHGDKNLLKQKLVNLIENAIAHCPTCTAITVALVRGEQGLLKVANHGPGIPENERENVFRRLYRLDKSRSTSSSGLGLSLVRAIAYLHGATVSAANNRPGTVITFKFGPPA
ncbi:MAG: sensor histidine kinase [Shinella sp.]|uniref:sensor histidine kinase n=1 Tax=Shinella sp. TaxID=1870904 RepID=UPI004035AA21